MQFFGPGLGALLIAAGLVVYFIAPRIGPNPFLGVRIGYAYASREVWDRTNRLGGLLLGVTGVCFALLGLLLPALGLSPGDTLPVLTIVLFAALAGQIAWTVLYARNLARDIPAARSLPPVPFRWSYLAPVLITFALQLVLAAWLASRLPSGLLATHFDFADQPNGYMERGPFLLSMLGLSALFVLIDAAVVLLATREPVIALRSWGAGWRLEPAAGLTLIGYILALTNLIMFVVFLDVGRYNLYGAHLFPLWFLLGLLPLFLLTIAFFFFRLARRVAA